MKKLLVLVLGLFFGLGLASCSGTIESLNIDQLSSKQSLATLSYLSTAFLSFEEEQTSTMPTNLSLESEGTVTSEELEEINEYFSLLKTFMDNGPDSIASVNEQASDRPEYDYLMDISVHNKQILLYYNINLLSQEITGVLVMDDVEYQITAQSSLDDFEEFDDDDDEFETENPGETTTEAPTTEESTTKDETTTEAPTTEAPTTEDESTELSVKEIDDEEDEDEEEDDEDEFDEEDELDEDDENEVKREMTLVASNGEDTITITYEFKSEEDEEKTEFTVVKNINGVEEELEVEIKVEEDEYKLEIRDGNNVYEFEMESEDNGEVEYKLEYVIDGEEGEIEIVERLDEQGNIVYSYEYEIEGERHEYEKDDAFDDDDDDEDEDDEDEYDDDEDDDDEDDDDDDDEEDDDEELTELNM